MKNILLTFLLLLTFQNNLLAKSNYEVILKNKIIGAEDLTLFKEYLYFGDKNGNLYRFKIKENHLEKVYSYNGRPLGIEVLDEENIFIADANLGLIQIDIPKKKIISLMPNLNFADDLIIIDKKHILLTNASYSHKLDHAMNDIILGNNHGEIIYYNLNTKVTKTLFKNLYFPNGITYNPKKQKVYFAQTTKYEISEFDFKDGDAKNLRPLLQNLQGFPDNINYDANENQLYIAFFAPRKKILDLFRPFKVLTKLLNALPKSIIPKIEKHANFLIYDTQEKKSNFLSLSDGSFFPITSALRVNNKILFGSLEAKGIAQIKLK